MFLDLKCSKCSEYMNHCQVSGVSQEEASRGKREEEAEESCDEGGLFVSLKCITN